MHKFYVLLSLSVLFLTSFLSAFSQGNIKFGKVSEEELLMKVYEKDSSADAIILYDKGFFDESEFQFKRHVRIKILNKTGTSWGNWTINSPSKGFIKAYVHNMVNGQVISEKVDNDAITEEQVINDFYVYKLFAPKVKEGTVIDIAYTHPGLPNEWRFQDRIPVLYNELEIERSSYLTYNKSLFGFEQIETLAPNKWRATHMPAFRMEEYISHYSNYITKFEFQIVSVEGGWYSMYLNTSWNRINSLLLDYGRFGGIINSGFLNAAAKDISAKATTVDEKISMAYKYIQDNITWNGKDALTGSLNIRNSFLKEHTGNSADINLLLIGLLQKLDLSAYPVVLSTRDNGFIVSHRPSMYGLNYVVAYVNDNGRKILMDATSKDYVPGIVPKKCLNGQGLVVHPKHEVWLNINQNQKKGIRQFINIKIDDEMEALATVSQQYSGYAYLDWMNSKAKIDLNKLSQQLENKYENLSINDFQTSIQKEHLKVNETIQVDISDKLISVDNELMFSPIIMPYINENPYKTEERLFPVDLAHPSEFQSTILIDLPEGFALKSLPESITMTMENGGGRFIFLSNQNGAQLQFQVMLQISRPLFTETEYHELKNFYTHSLEKMNEMIVLSKNI